MCTIAEILQKWERDPLYEQAASNDALKSNYQKFILHSNITAFALLKSELIQTNSIKTFVIINAANNTAPTRAHVELFRLLYHPTSAFLQWAYPPRVIVHTGDSNIEGPYRAIFSEYSLQTEWVAFASTVQGVLEEILRPVSSKCTNLPMVFRGTGSYASSDHPEFPQTVCNVQPGNPGDAAVEVSTYPLPSLHILQQPHINGSQ